MRKLSQSKRLVVGFAGPIGAGKTTGALHLANSYGFAYVRYSKVLADWMFEDPAAKGALQKIGWEVMSSGLQTELNQRVITRVGDNPRAAVDGLRHPTDEASLRLEYGAAFTLLFVSAPEELRWQRTQRSGRFADRGAFDEADGHEVERPLRVLSLDANRVIENVGSIEDYFSMIDRALGVGEKAFGGES